MVSWRESASLILAVRHGQISARQAPSGTFNYHLLCLKRSAKSSFMPGTYVFPGGTVEPADADLKWKHLFSNFGFDSNSFTALLPNTTKRPNIFRANPNTLSKEVSLRITAIRETFEECGILLCKQEKESDENAKWASQLLGKDLHTWQKRVHRDANQFFTLCEELNCYPDLWSLHEWSNWLTPTWRNNKRFDTAFFMVCLPFTPMAKHEESEMDGLIWQTPKELLQMNVAVPPPQHYEIARFAQLHCIEDLLKFAVDRSKLGVDTTLPVRVKLRDGEVYVLPGDCMYPVVPSLIEAQFIDKSDMTIEGFRSSSPVINRIEFSSPVSKRVVVENFESADGHLPPVKSETAGAKIYNKL